MPHPSLLPAIEAIIATLTAASSYLVDAARYAERDRFSLTPLGLIAGPMKYWKWRRARQCLSAARTHLDALRALDASVPEIVDAGVEISALDAINDLFDLLPFNVRRVGTRGGPSPVRQQLGVETTVLHQIETTRVGVDHLLSEVGLLHARLRTPPATARR